MQKKSIIAVLSAVVLMIVASLTLVFTVGPLVNADDDEPRVGYLDKAKYYSIDEDRVLSGLSDEGNQYAAQFDELHAVIPENVTSMRGYLKMYYTYGERPVFGDYYGKIVSVVLPESLKSIGDYALAQCNITSITIPNSVNSIGEDAFYRCFKLTSVTIPSSVTSIDHYAFSGCKKLTSVTLGHNVTSIDPDAFFDSNLTEIIVENEDLLTNDNLAQYADIMRLKDPDGEIEPEPEPEQETPSEQIADEGEQPKIGAIIGAVSAAAGILTAGGTVTGIVLAKRRKLK